MCCFCKIISKSKIQRKRRKREDEGEEEEKKGTSNRTGICSNGYNKFVRAGTQKENHCRSRLVSLIISTFEFPLFILS